MIGVVMAGRDNVDVQPRRVKAQLRHPYMRLVRVRVFLGERIGEVRIEEQMPTTPLQQKPALPQPPEMELLFIRRRAGDVL